MRKSMSPFLLTVKITLLITLFILLIACLSACYSTSTSTTNTNTPTEPGVTGSSITATSGSTSPIGAQTCGTIRVQAQGNTSNTQVAGDCFWHAYLQCQMTSLIVNFTSIDTITQRTFTIEPSSSKNVSCRLTEVVQRTIVPHAAKIIGNYECKNMNNTQQALTITACGTDGTISIPLK